MQLPDKEPNKAREGGAIWGLWIDERCNGADDVERDAEGDRKDSDLPHNRVGTQKEVGKPNKEEEEGDVDKPRHRLG